MPAPGLEEKLRKLFRVMLTVDQELNIQAPAVPGTLRVLNA